MGGRKKTYRDSGKRFVLDITVHIFSFCAQHLREIIYPTLSEKLFCYPLCPLTDL